MTSNNKYPLSGIYEHYKSTPKDRRYYQVLGVANNTETGEKLVIYIPLYTIDEHKGLRLQARPLEMFMGALVIDGKSAPRFRYIGPEL